jgi:hypothetical protein
MLTHKSLYFREAFPFQLPFEQFAAPLAELIHRLQQPSDCLFAFDSLRWIVTGIGQRNVLYRFLIILAAPERPAMGVQHLVPEDLKGKRNQFGQIHDMWILVMQDREDILREVLSMVP